MNLLKSIIYYPLYNLLVFFTWLVPGHSIGFGIILLTVLIRLLLLPSSIKASKASTKLQALQPKINQIRKEIKDQQEQGRALMQLYKDEGVSPFGSCLPMLLQIPILLVIYQVFKISLDSSHFNLLYSFTPRPETLNTNFLGLDLSKPDLWIMPIIAAGTQLILSLLMSPKRKDVSSDPTQMMMKQMVYFFPMMTFFIARTLPSALALYWVATTIFGIFQQLYVNRLLAQEKSTQAEIPHRKTSEKKANLIERPKKSDLYAKILNRKLEKREKQTGVTINIRKKGE